MRTLKRSNRSARADEGDIAETLVRKGASVGAEKVRSKPEMRLAGSTPPLVRIWPSGDIPARTARRSSRSTWPFRPRRSAPPRPAGSPGGPPARCSSPRAPRRRSPSSSPRNGPLSFRWRAHQKSRDPRGSSDWSVETLPTKASRAALGTRRRHPRRMTGSSPEPRVHRASGSGVRPHEVTHSEQRETAP